jgi:hypothetical protein
VPIYVNRATFDQVSQVRRHTLLPSISCPSPEIPIEKTFPYLVSRKEASGGGDLPEFEWHIIDNDKPFDVCGITVTPLPGALQILKI